MYSLTQLNKRFIPQIDNRDDSYTKYLTNKFTNTKNNGMHIDGFLRPREMLKLKAKIGKQEEGNKLVESNFGILKRAVVKISKERLMLENDYENSLKLAELKCPNFIRYYGLFTCKDDVRTYNIFLPILFSKKYNKNKILPEKFCKKNGIDNYFLFMPYFSLGSLESYMPPNTDILISIVNQVIGSSILALERLHFIHNDLHIGNILVRKTTKETITYKFINGDKVIKTYGIEIVMLDFDRSKFDGDFIKLSLQLNIFFGVYNNVLYTKTGEHSLRPILKVLEKITNIEQLKHIVGDE